MQSTGDFKNLPVYRGGPEVKKLDRHFRDTIAVDPDVVKDYSFVLNDDYSISLNGDGVK